MRVLLAIIALTTVGCMSSPDEEETQDNIPALPTRRPEAVTEATAPATPPAKESKAAPLPVDAKPFCANNTGHGQCFDFDDGKPFGEQIFNPPGKSTGSCAIVGTQTLSGTRSLLCSDAAGAFGVKLGSTLDLKVDAHAFIDGAAKPKTRFSFVDISALRSTGVITAQADFQVTFDAASPKGRIDFAISEQETPQGQLVVTAFPTKLTAEGWHQFHVHMRRTDAAGTMAVTAEADGVVVFDGKLRKAYQSAAQLSGAVGSDAGWNATNGSAPVFIDDVLVD